MKNVITFLALACLFAACTKHEPKDANELLTPGPADPGTTGAPTGAARITHVPNDVQPKTSMPVNMESCSATADQPCATGSPVATPAPAPISQ